MKVCVVDSLSFGALVNADMTLARFVSVPELDTFVTLESVLHRYCEPLYVYVEPNVVPTVPGCAQFKSRFTQYFLFSGPA